MNKTCFRLWATCNDHNGLLIGFEALFVMMTSLDGDFATVGVGFLNAWVFLITYLIIEF
jgi:hypothetical protein